MTRCSPAVLVIALLALVQSALAWGVAGHEVVATIAQIHLHQSARARIARILPLFARGHLAPVAAWADRIRFQMHWTGPLHYISPLGDYPPTNCSFVKDRYRSSANVLSAISNYTERLATRENDSSADIDLRFLVHYIGDAHMPLHLMERERGGNGDPVIFDGRHMSLHGLWDTQMIAKSIRTLTNYTRPLPSRQIESALRGSIYDSYVRFIVWEGIARWWRDDLADWLSCPTLERHQSSQVVMGSRRSVADACSFDWALATHGLTCSHVFPTNYDPSSPPELDTKDYYGRIRSEHVIERQLAMAGLRLASVLNTLLASDDDLSSGLLAMY